MKPPAKFFETAAHLTVRDEDGKVISRVLRKKDESSRTSWRNALRQMTNNGQDLYLILYNIAKGTPYIPRLEDGREMEAIIPSIEAQRQAAKDLIEFLDGKAVQQTEVVKAEEQTKELDRLRAMSDEDLLKIIEGEIVMPRQKLREGTSERPTNAGKTSDD